MQNWGQIYQIAFQTNFSRLYYHIILTFENGKHKTSINTIFNRTIIIFCVSKNNYIIYIWQYSMSHFSFRFFILSKSLWANHREALFFVANQSVSTRFIQNGKNKANMWHTVCYSNKYLIAVKTSIMAMMIPAVILSFRQVHFVTFLINWKYNFKNDINNFKFLSELLIMDSAKRCSEKNEHNY